jgi:OOP family OmpA-OmpF porin
VVAEGVVPDQATKNQILTKLRDLYGADRVVDRIQVENITAPPDWGKYVANMLSPELSKVTAGKLEVDGQSVRISGQVPNEALRQQVVSELSVASNSTYTITNSIRMGGSQQNLLDETLANRTIEFENGSARLTPLGMRILDEMASKMREMGDVRVQIIGHTDNQGQREKNLTLSQDRADAVRAYLVKQGVAAGGLSVLGKGPDEPTVSNATPDGRARNRRIQFKVLSNNP